MRGYEVKIKEVSKELTAKEKVGFKNTTGAVKLDEATKEGSVTVFPAYYGVLLIHNEKSDDKDYENYVLVDKETGNKFVTGSKSFWSSFCEIADEMSGSDEEWGVEIFRSPSKNYQGRDFITCNII